MRIPLQLAINFVALVWLPVVTPIVLAAQETFTFGDSYHEVEVSDAQEERLSARQDRLNDEIENLRDKLRTTQIKLRQRVLARNAELENLLEPEQKKSLNKQRLAETQAIAKANAEFMGKFQKFLSQLSDAGDLTIFEGLPRASDHELAKIKNENLTIEFDGWAFYRQPLRPNSSTVEKLRSVLVNYRSFEPYSGGKFCGGFHPDFCVQWTTNSQKHQLLICLTCQESVYVTPDGKTVFDFNETAWRTFIEIGVSTFTKHRNVIENLKKMSNGEALEGGMF